MKKIFGLRTVRRLQRAGRSAVCVMLSIAMILSFPIVLNAEENVQQGTSGQSNAAEYLGMPSDYYLGFGILPAHLAENTEYYASHDQAARFYYVVDTDECVVWKNGSWGEGLTGRTFSGRGAKIQTSYTDVLITDIGEYSAEIKPGVEHGYNYFEEYMAANAYQFQSRLVYLNEVDTRDTQARIASYAGDYDSNFVTQTITTDWGVTFFEGNTFYTVKDIMVLTADFQAPSDQVTVTGEVTADGTPIIWLDGGETVRPSAPNAITYEMLAKLKFKAYLVPKLAQSSAFTEVIFEATRLSGDYRKIGFTATDASALIGEEWRIVKLEDISEYGNYPLYTTKGDTATTVKSPVTDLAGNPFALDRTVSLTTRPVYLDAKATTVVSAELDSNAVKAGQELDQTDLFLAYGDWAEISLILSEQVFLLDGADLSDIKLKWDLTDKNGNYIVSSLKEIKTIKPSQNTGNVTKLVFDRITLAEGMNGQVRPLELIGAEHFEDASHNIMNGSVAGVSVDKQLRFDNAGPTLELGAPIKQIDAANEKYLIIKLRIADLGAGITAEDIQKLSVSSASSVEGLAWQYAITNDSTALSFTGSGYAVNTVQQYSDFRISVSGEYFLHLYFSTTEASELLDSIGVQLDFTLTDARGNTSAASALLTDLGIDRKAPMLVVTPHAVVIERADDMTNTTTFRADVTATDLNGIERIEYQWTDVGAAPTDNGWIIISSGDRIELTPDSSADTVTKILHVRAYDKTGNVSSYISDAGVFTANLQRINPRYELVYDPNKPGGISDVSVLAPVSSNAVYGGYTRVTLAMGGKTYVRVFSITSETEKVSLLDPAATDWNLVEISEGVYASVTPQTPDWSSYYGVISIALAASANDLTPQVNGSVSGEGDTTFQQGNAFEMIYTCRRDDVHQLVLTGVTDSAGLEVALTEANGYKFYKIYKSILGVKYHFSLTNVLMESLGVSDIDFANSYAQFVVLDAEGNRTGNLLGDPIPLVAGAVQSIAVPQSEYDTVSGAYGIVITIAQKSGGRQEFFLSEKLLFDNDPIPETHGVSRYERNVEYRYGDYEDGLIDMGKTAEAGQYLTSVDIGVVRPTEHYNGEDRPPASTIYVDGKPAFVQTVTNALGHTAGWTPSDPYIWIEIPTSGTTYFGQTIGKVAGIRIWNAASSGDPYALPWGEGPGMLYVENGRAQFSMGLAVGWYSQDEELIVTSPEELAAADVSDFKLAMGRNVICYQFIMENGKVSPESRFEINLFDEAPAVEMSLSFGPSITMVDTLRDDYTYPIEGTEYERVVAQSVYFNIDYAYSPNGALTVYQAYVDSETNEWVLRNVDGSQPIPMMSDSTNGYMGLSGTNSNYTTYNDPVNEIIIVVDAVGNATAFYPIVSSAYSGDKYEYSEYVSRTYYFEKNPDVGKFNVGVGVSEESDGGLIQKLTFNSSFIGKELDQFSIQIDGRKEVKLDTQSGNYDIFANANDAGLISYEYGELKYIFPYDPARADGEMIEHTVMVRGYVGGQIAADIDGNRAEHIFTISAPNVKPALTLNANPAIGAVGVTASTYLYAQGITERAVYDPHNSIYDEETGEYVPILRYTDNYSTEFALPVFEDGGYTYGFFDKYGAYYELPIDVVGLPNDPVISISETKVTKGPVTVTVSSTAGGVFTVDAAALPEGTGITGNGTSSLRIVLSDNASFSVSCTYAGESYDIPVSVTNIYNKPIVPVVVWNYNPYKVDKSDNSYEGEVTATLVDENGSCLTDENGVVPTFTFVPGGQTSYVFAGYKNHVGMTGAPVTATLPVTLKTSQTEESLNDVYAPDVGVTGYVKYQNGTAELSGGYVLTDTSRPAESQVMQSNYTAMYGAENLHPTISDLIAQVTWADALILSLDIIDENETKLFLSSDVSAAAPDYSTGTSDGIAGVSIVGRTLQITQNCQFALHIVDSKNNSATIIFSVDVLGAEPPAPSLIQALIENGTEVRIYLAEPPLEGVTDLKITNTDILPQVENDPLSAFFGQQYIPVTENKTVTVHYSYVYDGQTFTGSVSTTISCIDMTTPQVTSTVWSANYDGTGERYTGQDISLQMMFSKALSQVYVCDKDGNPVSTPAGVTVAFMQDRVTVIYEANTPPVYIKVVSSLNNTLTNIISLPEITTIDRTAPTLEVQVEMSENHTRATVTVTASETVTWPNGSRDTVSVQQVRQNGTYTYRVTDRAGNAAQISVTVSDIITEKLALILASDPGGSNIIDPETYDVNVGDTLYVNVNRDAYVTLNGNADGISVSANTWTAITIAEDAEGLYPSVLAVDAYGNSAIVQLLRIPMSDRTAPAVMLSKSLLSASLDMTQQELEEKLRQNVVATDDTTASDALIFSFDIPEVTAAGVYAVTYYVEDEAGNRSSVEGLIRFYSGEEILLKVNGEIVERDQYLIVDSGSITITLLHNGEPYKLEMREGNKSLGQMKNNAISLTDGYTDVAENEIKLELAPGYHTFLVTTQGRDMYRIVIYVTG